MRSLPTSAALALANTVLIALAVVSMAFGLSSVADRKAHLSVRLIPALAGIAAPLLALKLKPAIRMVAASACVGAGVGLYSAQLVALVLTDPERPALQAMEKAAKQDGVPFDGRTRVQVITDLRRRGVAAYPPFYPLLLLESPLRIDGRPTLPLGSMANVFTVCCNEGGPYLTYTTDEHGFPNPPGSWSHSPIDLGVIGSSQVVSESVPPADGLPALLRARYPNAVVIAAGGNGPLLELAGIREYLPALKPKRVLWVFSESHAPDFLERESQSPLLIRYLDPSYRQGLFEKQDALNEGIAQYFADGIQNELKAESWTTTAKKLMRLETIHKLMFFFVDARTAKSNPFQFKVDLYGKLLREGKNEIGAWGGTLTLVYWPDSSRYTGIGHYTPGLRSLYDRTHESVLRVTQEVGIPVIDLSRAFPDLPASEAARNAEYFYPYPAHFRPAGYHHAAEAILTALEAAP